MDKFLTKIHLGYDCNFKIETIKVLKDTKNGKYIGVDDEGKAIYETLPSRIWITEKGKFDSHTLGEIKKDAKGFYVTILGTAGTEYYKYRLKEALTAELECLCGTLEDKKNKALEKIRKVETSLQKAKNALKKAREIAV